MIHALKYSKWRAYVACKDLSKDDAMVEYLQLVAAQPNWFGQQCRTYLVEQHILPPQEDDEAASKE
jgi:hypothetical protein